MTIEPLRWSLDVVCAADHAFRVWTGGIATWGEVTAWEPPSRLAYLWFLRTDRADATDVEIRFVAVGESATRVEIEHSGWERLGDRGPTWRERNLGGWSTLLPHYRAALIPS